MLGQLCEGYAPTSPPAFAEFVKSINERTKILKGSGGTATTAAATTPAKAKTDEEEDIDEDTYLMLPFKAIVFHAFGEPAARCPDLDWMMNLLKCKAAFIHRMSFVVLKHFLTEEVAKPRLAELLAFDAGGGESSNNKPLVGGVPAGELTACVKSEVVRLLANMSNEKDLERLTLKMLSGCGGQPSQSESQQPQHRDEFYAASAIGFASSKFEIVSNWLRKELERETRERQTRSLTSSGGTTRQKSFSIEEQQSRVLKLEIIGVLPAFSFRSPHFGFGFLSSKNLSNHHHYQHVMTQLGPAQDLMGISRHYWNYLLLLLDILNVENGDFVVEETASTKLHEISKNVARLAFSPLHEHQQGGGESASENHSSSELILSSYDEQKEKTMQAMDAKCFSLLTHCNASVVLSTLRLLSSLLVLRGFGGGAQTTTTTTTTGEDNNNTGVEGGKIWKEARQKQIVAQAMALLTHR